MAILNKRKWENFYQKAMVFKPTFMKTQFIYAIKIIESIKSVFWNKKCCS